MTLDFSLLSTVVILDSFYSTNHDSDHPGGKEREEEKEKCHKKKMSPFQSFSNAPNLSRLVFESIGNSSDCQLQLSSVTNKKTKVSFIPTHLPQHHGAQSDEKTHSTASQDKPLVVWSETSCIPLSFSLYPDENHRMEMRCVT